MSIFGELQPERPLHYFEEICRIPHGSKATTGISNYIRDFAEAKNLRYIQDQYENVIIYKDSHEDYVNSPAVIIQGHMDMVCEKDEDCATDLSTDGLSLKVSEKEYDGIIKKILYAEGTTLGADDGVAICYMLSLLEDENLKAPALECVFTVDEEIGMIGASHLDYSLLKGRRMINIDNEEEEMILAGCAGGITATVHLPINRQQLNMKKAGNEKSRYILHIGGLTGGHSGEEIIKQRASANVLMGRTLHGLLKQVKLDIVSINGGLKDNAIPRNCRADIIITESDFAKVRKIISEMEKTYKREFCVTDPGLFVELIADENEKLEALGDVIEAESIRRAAALLYSLPNGVQKMSEDTKGLVQTSLNMGILKTLEQEITYSFSVRSSVATEKQELTGRLECMAEILGGYVEYDGEYPAWEYRKDSVLRPLMLDVSEKLFGRRPKTGTIHAGLECGIFSDNLEGLDCVSIGPDIYDIHTPLEAMDLESFSRCYELVVAVLERLI